VFVDIFFGEGVYKSCKTGVPVQLPIFIIVYTFKTMTINIYLN